MFSVIFEVHPKLEQWDGYLGSAKMLRPELEQVDGFVDNVRYKSLTREGWILSLSGWRDEKSVVRWRTAQRHHMVQEKGRSDILLDYHLRVGQVTLGVASYLGLHPKAAGLIGWDVLDAVLTPGDVILMITWKSKEDADAFAHSAALPPGGRLRQVRVVRDYGMFDRREAPQYYPAVERPRHGS
jgi:heme-degrading monooxygenase HmoA